MTSFIKLQQRKQEWITAQAELLVAKLLNEAQQHADNEWAEIDQEFDAEANYNSPCSLPIRPERCGLGYCTSCEQQYYPNIKLRKHHLIGHRFLEMPIRALFGLNTKTCDEQETCAKGANCLEKHGLDHFDPSNLKGLAKAVFDRLTDYNVGFTVEFVRTYKLNFRFRVRW